MQITNPYSMITAVVFRGASACEVKANVCELNAKTADDWSKVLGGAQFVLFERSPATAAVLGELIDWLQAIAATEDQEAVDVIC